MTRLELLTIVVARARSNGFDLRRWYTSRLGLPWINADAALSCLDSQRRYYALLFSHDFATAFWKAGEEISFEIPRQTFQRLAPDGTVQTVTRRAFTRRSARKDAWKYHLREMAIAEEPLRYLRRYLHVEEELIDEPASSPEPSVPKSTGPARTTPQRKAAAKSPRALPTELPAFLRRPYP
jgi:hypothetical protein